MDVLEFLQPLSAGHKGEALQQLGKALAGKPYDNRASDTYHFSAHYLLILKTEAHKVPDLFMAQRKCRSLSYLCHWGS